MSRLRVLGVSLLLSVSTACDRPTAGERSAGVIKGTTSTSSVSEAPEAPVADRRPLDGFTSPPPAGPGLTSLFEYAGPSTLDDQLSPATLPEIPGSTAVVKINGSPLALRVVDCQPGSDASNIFAGAITKDGIPVVLEVQGLSLLPNLPVNIVVGADPRRVTGNQAPIFSKGAEPASEQVIRFSPGRVVIENMLLVRGGFELVNGRIIIDTAESALAWLNRLGSLVGEARPTGSDSASFGAWFGRVSAKLGADGIAAAWDDYNNDLVAQGYAVRLDADLRCGT